ncbi:hypothetical protein BJX61DRAFT_547195 [Aspergillus egyptiacus]|nr:hypothetical protein BJX61DRAFT_547195 [Aspergillus egyptiacus]
MRLLPLLTLLATTTLTAALPDQAAAQKSCIGLNDRYCDNSTINYTCCPPLKCGSDSPERLGVVFVVRILDYQCDRQMGCTVALLE